MAEGKTETVTKQGNEAIIDEIVKQAEPGVASAMQVLEQTEAFYYPAVHASSMNPDQLGPIKTSAG